MSEGVFVLYKGLMFITLNVISPFLTCVVLPLQEFGSVYSKLDVPPLSGHAGISPTTQLGAILYKIICRSWGRRSALA